MSFSVDSACCSDKDENIYVFNYIFLATNNVVLVFGSPPTRVGFQFLIVRRQILALGWPCEPSLNNGDCCVQTS